LNNLYIITIGSNYNVQESIALAKEKLTLYFGKVRYTPFRWIEPIGDHYTKPFYDGAALLHSEMDKDELKTTLKAIEADAGRLPEMKMQGLVPLDLDIIAINGSIVHNDYQRFTFVKEAVDELLEREVD
jgi:2-amino-4-hydroxy-6-hydroxymethyldihydropteridine diphosphokinase